jgi:hypothetical protein
MLLVLHIITNVPNQKIIAFFTKRNTATSAHKDVTTARNDVSTANKDVTTARNDVSTAHE